MNATSRRQLLVDQGRALGAYLDELLGDDGIRAQPATQAGDPALNPNMTDGVAVTADPVLDEPGGSRFYARLIEVAGLSLAVPLAELTDLLAMPQDLMPSAGQSPLLIGEFVAYGGRTRIVDTARFILPAERAAALDPDASGRNRQLVVIDAGRWALACSQIGEIIELGDSDITRRGPDSRRQWLAGTLTERRCALLDINGLIQGLIAHVG